ncbi:hypothetical protein ACJJTC_001240 [Scirpophaga incertulas]
MLGNSFKGKREEMGKQLLCRSPSKTAKFYPYSRPMQLALGVAFTCLLVLTYRALLARLCRSWSKLPSAADEQRLRLRVRLSPSRLARSPRSRHRAIKDSRQSMTPTSHTIRAPSLIPLHRIPLLHAMSNIKKVSYSSNGVFAKVVYVLVSRRPMRSLREARLVAGGR